MEKGTNKRNLNCGSGYNISGNDNRIVLHSGPWATAIQQATAYAFAAEDNQNGRDSIASNNKSTTTTRTSKNEQKKNKNATKKEDCNKKIKGIAAVTALNRVECSLKYLETLRELLEQQENWEWVPYPCNPPTFHCEEENEGDDENVLLLAAFNKENKKNVAGENRNTSSNIVHSTSKSSFASTTTTTTKQTPTSSCKSSSSSKRSTSHGRNWTDSKNRYASIASDIDSDSDKEEEKEEDAAAEGANAKTNASVDNGLSPNAIPYDPYLFVHQEQHKDKDKQSETMDTVRILIRLQASQSDLHAKRARLLATQRRWLPGVGALQSSIVALAQGLELADTAISKTLAGTTDATAASTNTHHHETFTKKKDRMAQLERDAEIISVSTSYLVYEKDRYLKAAHKQVTKLERILKSMWESRDQARKRLGTHDWVHNPQSKGYFAKIRHQHEKELYSLEEALTQLEDSQTDASSLVDEAGRLREKLREIKYAQNRYNGKHMSFCQDAAEDAEDDLPVQYGWTFTGSLDSGREDRVEFYDKWIDLGSSLSLSSNRGVNVKIGVELVGIPSVRNETDLAATDFAKGSNGNNNGNGIKNNDQVGPFVLVQLDVHVETGAVRTVAEYPARYDGDEDDGSLVQPVWKLPLFFAGKTVDPGLYRNILADPLSVRSSNCNKDGRNY
mmetsp:Transcript_26839/g.58877  ORF Transcript_26839/g.58877 Transcript_26839/m.58877 type:complete len:674 (+) Transcript_26839:130-2151(+)|eukprot:CAMPEP_0168290504 /NCGR_PEP_ID=MMETSP0142_2-20121227/5387_1 /TAXON_ID=44445 /ORGANISM="Pseudo-nitzschia australis, Strain 10249 10 AB" /LENGTH=673 /DNA_ID=CAMNT_0008237603 /DNA_START=67 /DNA_END=2088 /DNA_ORIENTATION=+